MVVDQPNSMHWQRGGTQPSSTEVLAMRKVRAKVRGKRVVFLMFLNSKRKMPKLKKSGTSSRQRWSQELQLSCIASCKARCCYPTTTNGVHVTDPQLDRLLGGTSASVTIKETLSILSSWIPQRARIHISAFHTILLHPPWMIQYFRTHSSGSRCSSAQLSGPTRQRGIAINSRNCQERPQHR